MILMIGEGLSLKEISDKLNVSYDTILDDKKAIIKSGIKFLKSLGNKELSFYYQGIIEDINHIKRELWSILKNTNDTAKNDKDHYYPKDKLQAYKIIKECNTELREVFKESISLFVIEDYSQRIKRLEQITGIDTTGKKISYMNLDLPKLERDL